MSQDEGFESNSDQSEEPNLDEEKFALDDGWARARPAGWDSPRLKPTKKIQNDKNPTQETKTTGTSLANRLFSQPGDITLNGVTFHSCVLKTIEYFDKQFHYEQKYTLPYSRTCTVILKRFLYDQPLKIRFRKKLLLELLKMSDYLGIDLKKRFETGHYYKKKLTLDQELVLFQAGIDHEYQHADKFSSQMSIKDIKNSPKLFELYLRHALPENRIPVFLYLLKNFLVDQKNETLIPFLDYLNEKSYSSIDYTDLKDFLKSNFLNLTREERENNAFF